MRQRTSTSRAAPSGKKAFTLTELIVTAAAGAFAAAVFFPFLVAAGDQGARAACQENLRKLGIATQMYLEDYDDFLPVEANNRAGFGRWYVRLAPYVGIKVSESEPWTDLEEQSGPVVFTCPADESISFPSARPVSYAPPYMLVDARYAPMQSGGWHIGRVADLRREKHEHLWLADSTSPVSLPTFNFVYEIEDLQRRERFMRGNRHEEGRNFLMLDGSVEWWHYTQFLRGAFGDERGEKFHMMNRHWR